MRAILSGILLALVAIRRNVHSDASPITFRQTIAEP